MKLKIDGIAFPSTQIPDADPNTLDDYEEGIWTPVPTGLTVVGTPAYTGTYTKIGRLVFGQLMVTSSTSTASTANTTSFAGLPFPSSEPSTCQAVDNNINSFGNGEISSSTVFTPTWSARPFVYVTFWYRI